MAQRIHELCQQFGLAGTYWSPAQGQIYAPHLHVDFFSRRWYADLPRIGGQTRFVGGQARTPAAAGKSDAPVVLITLGSLFRHDATFFRVASEATLLEGGQPLIVTGQQAATPAGASQLPGLPAGVTARNWVDLEATLPQVAAIIHHGGVGTTHAALRHGLPQVAVPHAGDQHAQAGRITQAGVGYGLRPADFAVAARWAVRQLLGNELLRNRARQWQSDLAALGGVEAAATALETAFDPGRSVV
jgi:UDP:flavonoid glycosyltransferase YjiC (YdhE family)